MSYPPPPEGQPPGQQPPYGQPGYGYGQPGPGYGQAGPSIPYATWLYRVGGYLIDGVVLLLPGYVLNGIGGAFTDAQGNPTGTGVALTAIGSVYLLVVGIWNIVFRQGRTGWSVGKQVVGIRLISEKDGRPIGALLSFVRQIVHILDSLPCYLGYLWPLWDRKRQTFADKIMSTVVVHQRKNTGG